MKDLKLTESKIKQSEYEREKVIDLKLTENNIKEEYEYKRKEESIEY